MTQRDWDRLAAGQSCPFDAPRPEHTDHWDRVAALSASTLYLPHNQTYRGHVVLVFDPRHATRLDELTSAEWSAYSVDLHRTVSAAMTVCRADHVNVESLGNLMPHLHWHVVPRYKTDARWGAPIWAADLAQQPDVRLPAEQRARLIEELAGALR